MFNHECAQRNGEVVGACMDGFLFGACCQMPGEITDEIMESDAVPIKSEDNDLYSVSYSRPSSTEPSISPLDGHITSSGVSQITNALLNGVLPTAQDNAVVQIDADQYFSTPGVTHPTAPDTLLINQSNEISAEDFKVASTPIMEDRKTTIVDETTAPYHPKDPPVLLISISTTPPFHASSTGYEKPFFRPKPSKPSDNDKYVLVPTITYSKPNKTQEFDSIVNIIQMLNESSTNSYTFSTTKQPPSTSYILSSTHRPADQLITKITTKKTTYNTNPPKRKTTTPSKPHKRPSNTPKPIKTPNRKPGNNYISSSTFRPVPTKTTYGNSPGAFVPTKNPPSTSYIYSSTINKRPTTSQPSTSPANQYSSLPSSPTVIVLGPLSTEYSTQRPAASATYVPLRKPVTQVTINNHITQNIFSTEKPIPTVLITPKPSVSSMYPLRPTTEFDTSPLEIATSPNNLIDFPPVRNPNLNISSPVFAEDESTPAFVEDDVLNKKVESLVNKIIQGLQEPFNGLKDVVYSKNQTSLETTTKKPIKKTGTTKKPSTAGKPPNAGRPPSSGRPGTPKPATTKKPTTKRPTSTQSSKKPTTTNKKKKPTKKITTTTPSYIETEEPITILNDPSNNYRSRKYGV